MQFRDENTCIHPSEDLPSLHNITLVDADTFDATNSRADLANAGVPRMRGRGYFGLARNDPTHMNTAIDVEAGGDAAKMMAFDSVNGDALLHAFLQREPPKIHLPAREPPVVAISDDDSRLRGCAH